MRVHFGVSMTVEQALILVVVAVLVCVLTGMVIAMRARNL